ncbi:MAG: hypothetical protein JNM28_11565 [Armatimonadetes bacterium]|nr:hypothetical protein [Armatimonadota bacterium]
MRELVPALVAGLLGAAVLSPFIFKLLVRLKSAQNVSKHLEGHQHKQGTPTMGGLIVLSGLLCAMAFTWRQDYLAPLVLILCYAAVGFADDFLVPKLKPGSRGLHWMPKLGLEIGGAVAAAWLTGYTAPWQLALFVFMVLFLGNAYNFSDGLDTLSGGLGVVICLGLILLSMGTPAMMGAANIEQQLSQSHVLVLGGLAVSFLPFLAFNAPPARVFMGDVGSLPIGGILAWATMRILAEGSGRIWFATGIVLLVMFVEIALPPIQVFWVKAFKKRAFKFKTPIHHALEDLGWPHTRIVWLFHVVQASLVVLALAWVWQ